AKAQADGAVGGEPSPGTAAKVPNEDGASPRPPATNPDPKNGQSPRKPIDLTARQIVANVLRTQAKYDMERLWCEGAVKVHQEPSEPGDKGVDISGDTLQLDHHIDGNVLAVTGNHAKVQMNKISILGSEVNIDQTSNVVQVNGTGIMNMQNKKDFTGADLAK